MGRKQHILDMVQEYKNNETPPKDCRIYCQTTYSLSRAKKKKKKTTPLWFSRPVITKSLIEFTEPALDQRPFLRGLSPSPLSCCPFPFCCYRQTSSSPDGNLSLALGRSIRTGSNPLRWRPWLTMGHRTCRPTAGSRWGWWGGCSIWSLCPWGWCPFGWSIWILWRISAGSGQLPHCHHRRSYQRSPPMTWKICQVCFQCRMYSNCYMVLPSTYCHVGGSELIPMFFWCCRNHIKKGIDDFLPTLITVNGIFEVET